MTSKNRNFRRGAQSGSIMTLMLVVVAVIGVVSYVVMRLMGQVMETLGDEDMQVESQMLASDLKEYTKYLLTYEKLIFVNNPLRIGASRRAKSEKLWGLGRGIYTPGDEMNSFNVCGGYTMAAKFIGNLSLGVGDDVLCTTYLKNPTETGKQLEDSYLDQWANVKREAQILIGNAPTASTMANTFRIKDDAGLNFPEGQYRVRLNYSDGDSKWFENSDNSVAIEAGQNLFVFMRNSLGFKVVGEVDIDIFTDSFGLKSDFTERYIRITSRVTVDTPDKGSRIYLDQESFVMRIPTIKDFAIFVPYPVDINGDPTTQFSKSMKLGKKTQINGRVYFNGDIDTPLVDLPVFMEPVFISGRLTAPVTNAETALYRQKFRRGLITNLSQARYIFDGECFNPDGSKNMNIVNGSAIRCNDGAAPFKLNAYISNLQSMCRCKKIEVGVNGQYVHNATPVSPCDDPQPNPLDCPPDPTLGWVKNGYHEVEIKSGATHAFLASPIKKLTVKSPDVYLMGVVVGGYIDASVGAKFFGITAMASGMPGVGDATTLSQRTLEVNSLISGIYAPLSNMPLIQSSKDGFK